MTIEDLKLLRESEDKVEFKEAINQYSYEGKRKSVLGYTVALANEKGGYLILGVKDKHPHEICGTNAFEGREGKLEQSVYNDLGIRVEIDILFENSKRVMIIKVPSRPVGKVLLFEDVPLMRVGEELLRMSDEVYLAIIQEQEPDYSAKICKGLTIADLDDIAIKRMKESYARKQKNFSFTELNTEQVLNDLKLSVNGSLTYAALILLGKRNIIESVLPQSKINWEFRNNEEQIYFDSKETISEPIFLAIDKIWQLINQPTLNKKHPVQSGAYIFDLFDFNEQVIREAILNAIAHRDYTITSEILVKQYPEKIIINNPGGFPKGVTIENILTVSSTPRSRLMTEILEKTGLVERSGQGVDKIFSITLSEGKAEPDYKNSDMYQVSLVLRSEIIDKAFYAFLNQYQTSDREPKLGVEQIITLCKIREGIFQALKAPIVFQLEKLGLISKLAGHTNRYVLSEEYFHLKNETLKVGKRYLVNDIESLLIVLQGRNLKIGELENKLASFLNRNQIKYFVNKLIADKIITTSGIGKGTKYSLAKEFIDLRGDVLLNHVLNYLRELYENGIDSV